MEKITEEYILHFQNNTFEHKLFVLYQDYFETAFGFMGVLFDTSNKLVFIVLPTDKETVQHILKQKCPEKYALMQKDYFGKNAFLNYFQGKQKTENDYNMALSNLPINLNFFVTSEFQKQVLSSCALVPFGTTITYAELGMLIGTQAYQAIGGALSRNPLPLIIPCHRIVGKETLGGFTASQGIDLKKRMLALETPKSI